jgi:outer membrane lipoprotein SlyB
MKRLNGLMLIAMLAVTAVACNSPYRSDRGALFGGLTGAGVGAIVGNAVGAPGAGAAIGAGVGAVSGAAVGDALDDIEARNRAEIEARLGRPVAAGAVTTEDVIAMTRAGVAEENIIAHVRSHGMAAPLQSTDLIFLSQQGVSSRVIQTMQAPPQMAGPPMVVRGASPPPMIVHEVYGPPPMYWGPPCPPPYCRRPGVSWGVAFGH